MNSKIKLSASSKPPFLHTLDWLLKVGSICIFGALVVVSGGWARDCLVNVWLCPIYFLLCVLLEFWVIAELIQTTCIMYADTMGVRTHTQKLKNKLHHIRRDHWCLN